VQKIFDAQQTFFESGATLDIAYRKQVLKNIRDAIIRDEAKITAALKADLGKPAFESYETEIGPMLEEISFNLNHLKGWSAPKRVSFRLSIFPTTSARIHATPKGRVLIIAPWNYPFYLLMNPLVSAVAAGNCVIAKPSELAPATAAGIEDLIRSCCQPEHVAVVNGDVRTSTELLALPFDHIFYTGSTTVGKIVMEAAAKNLTPVTLELGGKSPCIVCADANLAQAAKRIAWGKFLNAGQTCVAPDYAAVHASVKDRFIDELRKALLQFYGADPSKSPDYGRIINDRHVKRLSDLLSNGSIVIGGQVDPASRFIAPTVIDNINWESPIMRDEIFGPLLPVLTFAELSALTAAIRKKPRPLALYLFTRDNVVAERLIHEVPFGGGCINDTIIHIVNPKLPFGGIGASGMGSCHGKSGFDTFTHYKSIAKTNASFDMPAKYPPYAGKMKMLKMVLK
jgi:acyl-CoA reductase-like NAD-dependent aldehyde dehydrogenase